MAKFKITTLHDNSYPEVEAITFHELVKHGLENGANINNGIPWSWMYNGYTITHENDECYLIPYSVVGNNRMTPSDMLITNDRGEIYIMEKSLFSICHDAI